MQLVGVATQSKQRAPAVFEVGLVSRQRFVDELDLPGHVRIRLVGCALGIALLDRIEFRIPAVAEPRVDGLEYLGHHCGGLDVPAQHSMGDGKGLPQGSTVLHVLQIARVADLLSHPARQLARVHVAQDDLAVGLELSDVERHQRFGNLVTNAQEHTFCCPDGLGTMQRVALVIENLDDPLRVLAALGLSLLDDERLDGASERVVPHLLECLVELLTDLSGALAGATRRVGGSKVLLGDRAPFTRLDLGQHYLADPLANFGVRVAHLEANGFGDVIVDATLDELVLDACRLRVSQAGLVHPQTRQLHLFVAGHELQDGLALVGVVLPAHAVVVVDVRERSRCLLGHGRTGLALGTSDGPSGLLDAVFLRGRSRAGLLLAGLALLGLEGLDVVGVAHAQALGLGLALVDGVLALLRAGTGVVAGHVDIPLLGQR